MTGKLCFWAILSNTDLSFIYFSPSLARLLGIPPNVVPDVLKGKTLWELIHPEEYALAREDLKKFMDNKHIGGSVTRYFDFFFFLARCGNITPLLHCLYFLA
jgi:PAS domain-containing protein